MSQYYNKCKEAADYLKTKFDASGAIGLVPDASNFVFK